MAALQNPKSKIQNTPDGAGYCEHCGGLSYDNTLKCPQCKRFPIKIHCCPRCKCLSAKDAAKCWKCGRVFAPDSEYL